jgi:hypothetical protein
MSTRPISAIPGGGNWMKDSSGMMVPVGGSFSGKELMQLPKEMREITLAANTLIRGNFSKDLWPDLAMLNAIAPRHRLTQVFIASITAGSMAENGQATTNALFAMVNMLVPSALSPYKAESQSRRRDGHKAGKNPESKVAEEDE